MYILSLLHFTAKESALCLILSSFPSFAFSNRSVSLVSGQNNIYLFYLLHASFIKHFCTDNLVIHLVDMCIYNPKSKYSKDIQGPCKGQAMDVAKNVFLERVYRDIYALSESLEQER